ncbi:MAG: hypothetical protein KatS3mg115_2053 [Candidatus Poribacteria bacterium]|nr:MAG: hypothetical protein KatS3mg115_2053 [Candidatus Poribacteria bacterium]
MQPPFASYEMIRDQLQQEYAVQEVDLSEGVVPEEVNVLVLIAPQNLTDKERFAVDQFLMRGGSLVVATSPYTVEPEPFTGSLTAKAVSGGVREMLKHYGVTVGDRLVMDMQSAPFPLPVERNVGGFIVREIRAMAYPFFVDVQREGMERSSPIVANLPVVTLPWAAPVELDEAANANREAHVILRSSERAWLHEGSNIQPNLSAYPELGFPVGTEQRSYPLAVAVRGSFESYFKGKTPPFQREDSAEESEDGAQPSERGAGSPGAGCDRVQPGHCAASSDRLLGVPERLHPTPDGSAH